MPKKIALSDKANELLARLRAIDTSDLPAAFHLQIELSLEAIGALRAGSITVRESEVINKESGRVLWGLRGRVKEGTSGG